eukprot:79398_1
MARCWLMVLVLMSLCTMQGNGHEHDRNEVVFNPNSEGTHRILLGIEDEKITVGDDEKVIILSMSSVWFKGIIAMNIGIFLAVMLIFVMQCKQFCNQCMNRRRRYHHYRATGWGDSYDKLQLTTDVTELDTVYEDDQD